MPSALPLTLKDLEAQAPKSPKVVAKIRDSHHQLARLVAEGQKIVEISFVSGYSPGHINRLMADPAFQELVTHYQGVVEEKYLSVHERISALATDTIQEIRSRLDEEPDSFTIASLTEIAKVTLDRSGFGPQKTINQTTITAQVTSDDLARIRAQKSQGGVRQVGQKTQSAPDDQAANRGAQELPVIDLAPVVHPQGPALRLAGEGHTVREEVRGAGPDGVRPDKNLS